MNADVNIFLFKPKSLRIGMKNEAVIQILRCEEPLM